MTKHLITHPVVYFLSSVLTLKNFSDIYVIMHNITKGAQWLSGRVLDSGPKGRGFEPRRGHCVVSLSKTH